MLERVDEWRAYSLQMADAHAERYRAMWQRYNSPPAYGPLLARLGRLMVVAGERLQARGHRSMTMTEQPFTWRDGGPAAAR